MRQALTALAVMLAVALPASADDDDLKDDLAKVQGKWSSVRTEGGMTLRTTKEIKGNKEKITIADEDGAVLYAHENEFKLEKSGRARLFTYFNLRITEGPN